MIKGKIMGRTLDKMDLRILRILQSQGRISFTDLGEQVNLSTSSCIERVKRLEKENYIQGYYARLNPDLLGLGLLVYVEINLAHKSEGIFEELKEKAQIIPEIMECHLVSGDFDYLLKLRINEINEYRKILGKILLRLPNVVNSKSYIVMEELKESSALNF